MSTTTAVAIYFLIWWVTLFAVLPFGVRSQHEGGEMVPGSDPGAPVLPRVLWKLFWTTIWSGVIFAILYVIYVYKLIAFEVLTKLFRMPRG
jgi:predicted secreted protein